MKEKIVGYIAITILGGFILFGSYQYYFKKPVPIVNNTTVESGATMQVEQGKQNNNRLFTGLYGSRSEIGVVVGWGWSLS